MAGSTLAFGELVLVLGGALGFCLWQMISIRREQARDRAAREGRDAP